MKSTPTAEQNFYLESCVAERFGVTRHALENFRSHELKKTEWKKEGRDIYLSERAIEKLRKSLGDPDVECSSCLKNGSAAPELVQLVVIRTYPNPRLLLARFPDPTTPTDAAPVRVQCLNNANFRTGMKIKAKPPTDSFPLYRLEGRGPRFPGRW